MDSDALRLAEDLEILLISIDELSPQDAITTFFQNSGHDVLARAGPFLRKDTAAYDLWYPFVSGTKLELYAELKAILRMVIRELRRGGSGASGSHLFLCEGVGLGLDTRISCGPEAQPTTLKLKA